jgi:hypothetical protein
MIHNESERDQEEFLIRFEGNFTALLKFNKNITREILTNICIIQSLDNYKAVSEVLGSSQLVYTLH